MKETVYSNPWFSVIQDGKWHYIEEQYAHNGAVILIQTETKKFVMVKIYRKAIESYVYETPRGYGNKDEVSIDAAIRETFEETGYLIRKENIKKIGTVTPNSAILSSNIDVFLAKVNSSDLKKSHDDEVVETIEFDQDDIFSVIKKGLIKDSFTLSAICLYMAENNCNWPGE